MAKKIRRVVTGHDAAGKAICISDDFSPCVLERPSRPGVALTNLWELDAIPASINGPEETIDKALVLHPPKTGAVFRIVEFQPEDPDFIAKVDGQAAFAAMGASHNVVANARHPYMHKTETVDFAVVLEGEITMLLDDEDVVLKAGDTVVQRGTNHAWANRGTETCRIAFVLIDGDR